MIFDLDNTLIDFMRMKRVSCNAAMEAMIDAGLKIKHSEGMNLLFKMYELHGMEDQQIFQKFLKKTNNKIDYRMLAQGILAYRRVREGFLVFYPGTMKTLIELKARNTKIALVSDAPRLQAWMRLCALNLDDFFDVVVTHEDTGKNKPNKLPFKAALEKLNLRPEECLMVGDNPERDVKGAKRLGIRTVLAKYGCTRKITFKADHEINKIEELINLLDKA
ncbi:HAD-IA family hydrolase [archaeon]|nr:HAD-IA family hydrolase [archaeon]